MADIYNNTNELEQVLAEVNGRAGIALGPWKYTPNGLKAEQTVTATDDMGNSYTTYKRGELFANIADDQIDPICITMLTQMIPKDAEGNALQGGYSNESTISSDLISADEIQGNYKVTAPVGQFASLTSTVATFGSLDLKDNTDKSGRTTQACIRDTSQKGLMITSQDASAYLLLEHSNTGTTRDVTLSVNRGGWEYATSQVQGGVKVKFTINTTSHLYPLLRTVYWYRIVEGKADKSGSIEVTFPAQQNGQTSEISTYLYDSDLETNWLKDDYVGFGLSESLAKADAQASKTAGIAIETARTTTIASAFVLYSKGIITVAGDLLPRDSNQLLGGPDNKWANIYAVTSSIGSSDAHLKNTVAPLTRVHEQIFDELKPVSYKFNENTSDRTHTGFIAQDVKAAVEKAGLTTQDFATYCEWETEGGGTECGLRYEELIALCVNEIQKLKKRVAELEGK